MIAKKIKSDSIMRDLVQHLGKYDRNLKQSITPRTVDYNIWQQHDVVDGIGTTINAPNGLSINEFIRSEHLQSYLYWMATQ